MTKKEILFDVLRGMDPYLSCGVPEVYWDLAMRLATELYGERGAAILSAAHKTYRPKFDASCEVVLHSIHGWEDGGNTEITPDVLVARLNAIKEAA